MLFVHKAWGTGNEEDRGNHGGSVCLVTQQGEGLSEGSNHSLARGETALLWEPDLQVLLFVCFFLPSFGELK